MSFTTTHSSRGAESHDIRPGQPHTWRQAWSGRRFARLVQPDGRCRVLALLPFDDPRLDVPTYLRRGLRIPGINCDPV